MSKFTFQQLAAVVSVETTRMRNGTYTTSPPLGVTTIGEDKSSFVQGRGLTEFRSVFSWVNNNRSALEKIAQEKQ